MKKVVITSGYFNPLHIGHINLFREAKSLGDFLVVIINNDEQVRLKGSVNFMPEQERVDIIKAIRYVDEVFLSIDKYAIGKHVPIAESLKTVAKKYAGSKLYLTKGGDRNAGNIPEDEVKACEEFNIEIVNNVGGGKVQSSSWLLKNIVNK